jgi:L-lysine 2,3-aminomutase
MHPARPQPSTGPVGRQSWQVELARGYRDPAELLGALGLTAAECGLDPAVTATDGTAAFPLRVPRGFVARMRPGDPADPLLLQVLPSLAESLPAAGFVADPVGDLASARAPGLLQKYAGRALLITTGACAIHCRYCFRREYPYADQSAAAGQLDPALRAIAADATLQEIILSGGDPLVLSEQRLEDLLLALDSLPHVQRIRLHSRVPVVLPERVDSRLLATLGRLRARVVVVIHANHANEITAPVVAALRALAAATGPILNQSVLLRRVNASLDALAGLSTALFSAGVIPYYLHQLDPVSGAAHFAVTDADAVTLVTALSQQLPGYLVPRLVRETAGAAAKTLLGTFGTT